MFERLRVLTFVFWVSFHIAEANPRVSRFQAANQTHDCLFPTDDRLLTLSPNNLEEWNVANGARTRTRRVPNGLDQLNLTPDGAQIPFFDSGRIKFLNPANGDVTQRDGFANARFVPFAGAVFSPDGRFIAAPKAPRGIGLWNAQTGAEVGYLPIADAPNSFTRLLFSPDNQTLAISYAHNIVLWDLQTQRSHPLTTWSFDEGARRIVFSKDGRYLFANNNGQQGTLRVYEVISGLVIAFYQEQRPLADIALSSDGSTLAAFWPGQSLYLHNFVAHSDNPLPFNWNRNAGERSPIGHRICFSPNGHFLALVHDNWEVQVYDTDRFARETSVQGLVISQEQLAHLWSRLGSTDAGGRTALLGLLQQGEPAVALVRDRLTAEATAYRAPAAIPEDRLNRLVRDLGNNAWLTRQAASRELAPLLAAELEHTLSTSIYRALCSVSGDAESVTRAEQILGQNRPMEYASIRRTARAVEVLEGRANWGSAAALAAVRALSESRHPYQQYLVRPALARVGRR